MTSSIVERLERCRTCKNVWHPYLFPYKNPDATLPDPVRRTIKPTPAATFEARRHAAEVRYIERFKAVSRRRIAAQAEGRDYTKCLPCLSREGGSE